MKKFTKFLKDTSGVTAVTFGLMLVPLMGVTGLAVDYSRASHDRSQLQNAADSAVLAGATLYTGNNLPAVKTRIHQMLQSNVDGFDDSGATYSVAVTDDVPARITLSVAKPMETTFMKVLNQNKMDIGVVSEASGALTPTEATFTIKYVKGIYYKKISVIVVRENGAEEEVAALEYTNVAFIDGKGVSVPKVNAQSQIFQLGKFKDFYFTMIVKKDGCGLGKKPNPGRTKCVNSNSPNDQLTPIPAGLSFDQETKLKKNANAFLVRSNNANDAWRLALDGATTTTEEEKDPVTMDDLMNCDGQVKKHGWEDGGGTDPDFLYEIKTGCSVNYENVRLTQ